MLQKIITKVEEWLPQVFEVSGLLNERCEPDARLRDVRGKAAAVLNR